MAELPVRQRIVVPFDGHVIGQGFNSDTAERVGTGLIAESIGEDIQAPGQTGDFRFHMLTSQQSLEKSLNIGAEVEARYALFSGGAKFDFAESSALNTTSTYVLASCVIQNALRSGRGFTPTEAADRLIREGAPAPFKLAFGDRFTEALHTGGEFYAVVRITSSNTMHQSKISASLHGEMNGFVAGGEFKAALTTAQNDASSHTQVDMQVHQSAGVGDQLQIPEADAEQMPHQIIEHMNRFARAAHENAKPYAAELVTYDTLALPFPPPMELEDRRVVLEDCLARRQRYFSAISELEFALSENADLIFENLPPQEELVRLQNDLRSALNALMDHARKVSSGIIEPKLFVIVPDPLEKLPRFKRRTTGSFASWWTRAKQNDPGLLQDERTLIQRIAQEAAPLLTVPLEEASPETIERAADTIEKLHLEIEEPTPPLRSMASLPKMIDAPLRKIWAQKTHLGDLAGLEEFARLEFLLHDFGRLRDIQSLVSAAGLQDLRLRGNEIEDLTPLRALTTLETLCVQGNRIQSLDPLRELHTLSTVVIASEDFTASVGIDVSTGFMDNPISDARALGELPRLANPLTSADRLRLKLFEMEGNFDHQEARLIQTSLATRIGDTNRFQFGPAEGGESEQILLTGLLEYTDLNLFPMPIVVMAVHFPTRGVGIVCTRPSDRSTSLPAIEVVKLCLFEPDFVFRVGIMAQFSQFSAFDDGGAFLPSVFLEVEPA